MPVSFSVTDVYTPFAEQVLSEMGAALSAGFALLAIISAVYFGLRVFKSIALKKKVSSGFGFLGKSESMMQESRSRWDVGGYPDASDSKYGRIYNRDEPL